MSKVCYVPKNMGPEAMRAVELAYGIIVAYEKQGYQLTLRQVYYQFVARDLFPDDRTWRWTGTKWVRDPDGTKNAEPNYKWLGDVVSDGRLAGYLPWDAIVDRTRESTSNSHWTSPRDIVSACVNQYQIDKWSEQDTHVEVWIEKDALEGVVEPVCKSLDVTFFSCRGYVSLSAMWEAGQRLKDKADEGKEVVILHLGDHDPSGVDMTRDIENRLAMFMCDPDVMDGLAIDDSIRDGWYHDNLTVKRIALTMDQVRHFNPPPNPAKLTDARARGYIQKYGKESWELDALEPSVLAGLVTQHVEHYLDTDLWEEAVAKQTAHREAIKQLLPNLPA